MAHIRYRAPAEIPPEHRIDDDDNIIRVHGCSPRVMHLHYELYRELMYGRGPLSRVQREMIGVAVSAANDCHY